MFVKLEWHNKPPSWRTTTTRVEKMHESAAELRADFLCVNKVAITVVSTVGYSVT